MTSTLYRQPARSSARANNPNAAKNRGGNLAPAPRLGDGVRRPVRIYWETGARSAPILLGNRPLRRATRPAWTISRLMLAAERAEARGWNRVSENLLAAALELEAQVAE